MEFYLVLILSFVLAYITGSIPTAVWIGKILHNTDVREHGSGNAGATNTMRVLGVKVGLPVLLFDIFKGWLATRYALMLHIYPEGSSELMNLSIVLGVIAVVGHIFPVFASFKGGKGVASIFGVLLALAPIETFCAAGVFLVVLFLFKYVSLGSVLAGLSFPVWIIFVFDSAFVGLKIFSAVVALLLIFTHRKNLQRLIKGNEAKASFLFPNSKS